ncbi:MAG: DUF401 family protein, partial [Dethiobacteria bacterium]|nr:DUF401 family protein [Dethiobacteria bacterium]
MYTVLLLATATLALTNGGGVSANINLLYQSITSYTAYYLVLMVVAITLLGNLHQKIGAMEQLVDNLRLLIRDPRALLMIFPAAISLFSTVPGGAIISAPMVAETGRELKMSPVELAMSNMVYRHLVVLITPYTASIVLASGITGISITGYLSFTVPVVLIVFAIATALLLIRYPKSDRKPQPRDDKETRSQALLKVLVATLPYVATIILGLAFGLFFPLALLVGIVICFFINLPRSDIFRTLFERVIIFVQGFNWPIALSTLIIVMYKDFMLEAESFQQVVHYLITHGLPLMLLLVALPFITGFITGNTTASLGIALPVLMPFLSPEMLSVRYFGLIYVSAYAGYLGSPVHLCTYLTNEYFKTPMYALIKQVNVYGLIMLVVGLTLSLFY